VQAVQPPLRRAEADEGELGDLTGGEHLVVSEHVEQQAVAAGEPAEQC
jgi:hypothetical protein